MVTYSNSLAVGSTVTVTEQQTATGEESASAVGIVGTYDGQNGSYDRSTDGDTVALRDAVEAEEMFGEQSQLAKQTRLAQLNGNPTIVVGPVSMAEETQSFTGTSSGTIDSTIVDPRFSPTASLTVTDTQSGNDIDVSYVDGDISPPSSGANVNPQTGEVAFSTSSDYDVTFDTGEYDNATTTLSKRDVATVAVCHTSGGVTDTALSNVDLRASQYDFKRGVGSVPTGVTPSSYEVGYDTQRLVLGAPAYGTTTNSEQALLAPSIASRIASQALAESATKSTIRGFKSLSQEFTPTEVREFGEGETTSQVTVVFEEGGEYKIAEDLTTSTGSKFTDVYRCEIIDYLTYNIHTVADSFIEQSKPNTGNSRNLNLETPTRRLLRSASNQTPPLLASVNGGEPFAVSTSGNPSDDEEAELRVALDVVGLAKRVKVPISVGAISSFGGAN